MSLHEDEEARMRPDNSNSVHLGMHTARGLHKVRMVTITWAWRLPSALACSSACQRSSHAKHKDALILRCRISRSLIYVLAKDKMSGRAGERIFGNGEI